MSYVYDVMLYVFNSLDKIANDNDNIYLSLFYYIIFLSIWIVLLLPTSVIEILPGYLFGFKLGIIASTMGKTFGSLISLLIGRYLLRKQVEKFIINKFPITKAFSKAIAQEGFKMVIAIRLAYLPMVVKNYGLAIVDVPIYKALLAGIITGIPVSLLIFFFKKNIYVYIN